MSYWESGWSGHEVTGCKRRDPSSRSEGPQKKENRGPERQMNKIRKTGLYHLCPRNRVTKEADSRSSEGGENKPKGPSPAQGNVLKTPIYNQSRQPRRAQIPGRQMLEKNQKERTFGGKKPKIKSTTRATRRQKGERAQTSRWTASLEVLIEDINDRRNL
ncbi:hypothetical protein TNIN_236191 [Trichonephila inaurata madagascariensis]|uniref:Uncharacterized protein n=1 Tax=Trichonephila inaurata madagascariensis TaxID=2747483 RepID=A0A8X6YUH0_9ARAC|nr:hypothetical protein TNIN_236191 [Trichonephila inaurata madagascariensis]